MDISKYFEPLEKFVNFIVSRLLEISFTFVILWFLLDDPQEYLSAVVAWARTAIATVQTTLGIAQDQAILTFGVVVLFLVFFVFGVHSLLLGLASSWAPIRFSLYLGDASSYYDPLLLWRGYGRKLTAREMLAYIKAYHEKHLLEQRKSATWKSGIGGQLHGYAFICMILFVFGVFDVIEVREILCLLASVVILLAGYVYQMTVISIMQSTERAAAALSTTDILEMRFHDFEDLAKDQVAEMGGMVAGRRASRDGKAFFYCTWWHIGKAVIKRIRADGRSVRSSIFSGWSKLRSLRRPFRLE